jgi:head-tail adaptor
MVLKTGDMRSYCEIQQPTRVTDGQGGFTVSGWTNLGYQWFKATPISMSRSLDESGVKYKKAVSFEGWYRDDLPTDLYTLSGAYRIVWNSENYTIHSVLPDETNTFIKILGYV